ncbi:glycosyltransferase [Desulfobacterota bacterium AH_259_B03_O07]|nr:glycosyltransferase [Desulfobacterota bacterium AH_259_B03_O07]
MPKVTVLMSVYNGELYLREAIHSILLQTFEDFEFLIINDGSTDNSRKVIQSYKDPRIKLIDNEHNLGLTESLNKGFAMAEGEFIARQDADDISEPERLASQVAFLEKNPEVALLGTGCKWIDENGKVIGNSNLPCDTIQILWYVLFRNPFLHSSVMFRKSAVLEKIGLFNYSYPYAQDWELWSRIARSLPVAILDEYLIKYRNSPYSMTATYGSKVHYDLLRIRISNIGFLLGWDTSKSIANYYYKVKNIISLLYDSQTRLSNEEINNTIDDLLMLQTSFSQYYSINQNEYTLLRAKLFFKISHCFCDQGNYRRVYLYLKEVYKLKRTLLLSKSILFLSFKLFIGPNLFWKIRLQIRYVWKRSPSLMRRLLLSIRQQFE